MDENLFMANAAVILKGWADFAAAGGLGGPPANVPRELLDMNERVANAVPTLIGVALAIHAAGKPVAAHTLLSLAAKTAKNSPDAVAKTVPLAIGLARWAGAERDGILRGLGCMAALALLVNGASEPPEGSIAEMVAGGATWGISLPGQQGEVTLEMLGASLASAYPQRLWADDPPKPDLFAGWAAYFRDGGLDRPIDSVPFPLLGGAGASDEGAGLMISAAMRLAAGGHDTEAAWLLKAAEAAARQGEHLDPAILSRKGTEWVRSFENAAACYAALALWHSGALRCLDPGHTLRKMAAGLATRFTTAGTIYTVGEFSRGRGATALRELRRANGESKDAEP